MGLLSIDQFCSILVCPRCRSDLAQAEDRYLCTNPSCAYFSELCFPVVGGYPVLVDFERSILIEGDIIGSLGASPIFRRSSPLGKKIRNALFSTNPVAEKNAGRFRELLKNTSDNPVVLVVGGAAISSKIDALYNDPSLQLISFDIYGTPLTQFIADGHQIPLDDRSVDGVWTQAVLEHVLDPWQVVSEIYRVLKKDGIVYSEVPFMQQVHSGPYDFTRFSESGHRWLFKRFMLIDSVVVQGPGTQLLWTIDHVSRSVFRSVRMGLIIKTLLFWLRYIDKISPTVFAVDNASGVFFLGRRSEREINPKEMINHYKGAQKTRTGLS